MMTTSMGININISMVTNTDMGITDTSITTKIKVTTQKKIRRKMKAVVLALATAAKQL